MQSTAYADPILLSTHADQDLLYRSSAALRLLRLMQSWASHHIVEPGRGIVWVARGWLQKRLGVSRSQYFRVLARLLGSGWIVPSTVSDETGQERPGYRVALTSASGFATDMRPRCDLDATQMRPRCDSPTLKLNEGEVSEGKAAMTRPPRQSNLPGQEFQSPAQHETGTTKTTLSINAVRDPRLNPVARRVDEYERARYIDHPRCVRPKRDTPEAHSISVEAITRALERVLASGVYSTLEDIEMRFRGVVELNWDAADRKQETWEWWSGTAMWAPNSLERVLGWLDEKRNWVYLERAAGLSELPSRPDETGLMPDDVADLSPVEQQAAYDEAHGIEVPGGADPETYVQDEIRITVGGIPITGFADGRDVEISDDTPEPGQWRRWLDKPLVLDIQPPAECEGAQQLSDAVDRGDPAELEQLTSELAAHFQLPKSLMLGEVPGGLNDEELRRLHDRKLAYMKATTPEERVADAKAGRKPWEVR